MRLFVMRLSKSYIRQFVAQTGQHMRSLETGRSAASAVVASVDWSVEYPFPLPPKVQVHLLIVQWFAMSCLIPKLSKHMSQMHWVSLLYHAFAAADRPSHSCQFWLVPLSVATADRVTDSSRHVWLLFAHLVMVTCLPRLQGSFVGCTIVKLAQHVTLLQHGNSNLRDTTHILLLVETCLLALGIQQVYTLSI